MLFSPSRATAEPAEGAAVTSKGKRNLIAIGVASVVLLALLLYGLGTFNAAPPETGPTSTTSTSYSISALSVLSSTTGPASSVGYIQGSIKQLTPKESGLVTAGYSLFSDQAGDAANMTILVFNSTQSAQRYTDSVIRNAQELSGYSNANSTLSGYQHYGICYGYAQTDPEGNGGIATGVCDKGNVYIQVHFVSAASAVAAEGAMATLVGEAYQGVA